MDDQRYFGEIGSSQEADREADFEEGGDPRQHVRDRKSRTRDLAGRGVDSDERELKRGGHDEHEGEDQPGDEDSRRLHRLSLLHIADEREFCALRIGADDDKVASRDLVRAHVDGSAILFGVALAAPIDGTRK